MYERITSENVVMYAIKNYNNPQCEGELEFLDDLKDLSTSKDYLKISRVNELRERSS